jgi:hypothetical protein
MDLDDILNDALEEVTKDEDVVRSNATASASASDVKSALSTAAASTAKTQDENAAIAASQEPSGEEAEIANLLKMFGAGSDFEKVLDDAFKDMDLNDLMSKLGLQGEEGATGATGGGGDDAEMEKLMKLLSGAAGGPGGAAPGAGGMPDPKLLEQLASKLESSMGGDQMNKMFENMMKSVMSKDIMYEPIKAITEEYPRFLAEKKNTLSSEDKSRFESQFSAYRALRATFEQDPDNTDKIMQIMQDLERYGQPPEEISKILGAQGAAAGGGMPNPNACPTQ